MTRVNSKGIREGVNASQPVAQCALSRRQILVAGAALVLTWPLASAAQAVTASAGESSTRDAVVKNGERRLRFHHTHTGEDLDVVYWQDGVYDPAALARLDHILRDHRSGEVHEIDRELLDLLVALALQVGNPDGIFEIISGYRSAATNEKLREAGGGVAKYSQHMQGKAIDLRLRGTDTRKLQEAALALKRGGVGFYRSSDFVHIDTGRVRRW